MEPPFVSEPHEKGKVVLVLLNYKLSIKPEKPEPSQEVQNKSLVMSNLIYKCDIEYRKCTN